jgi:hypothetical protein
MVVSINSRIIEDFLKEAGCKGLIDKYYKIPRGYKADSFICGRITMESSFPQLIF